MALTDIDRLLIKRCLDRAPHAWHEFVDRYAGLFCHVVRHTADARNVTLSAADVDDVVGEVFREIVKDDFRVLRNFRQKSSLSSYLTVVARRVVVREIVAKRRLEFIEKEVGAAQQSASSGNDSVRVIEDADEIEALLKRLPDREAELLRQYHLEGRSYREISEHFDLAENSVGAALSRARQTLAEIEVR